MLKWIIGSGINLTITYFGFVKDIPVFRWVAMGLAIMASLGLLIAAWGISSNTYKFRDIEKLSSSITESAQIKSLLSLGVAIICTVMINQANYPNCALIYMSLAVLRYFSVDVIIRKYS